MLKNIEVITPGDGDNKITIDPALLEYLYKNSDNDNINLDNYFPKNKIKESTEENLGIYADNSLVDLELDKFLSKDFETGSINK
jgi:hypothetical protein